MIEVIHPIYPHSRLYKYRYFDFDVESSGRRFQTRLLTNRELHFSSPKDFNDPFDFCIPIRFLDGTEDQIKSYLSQIARREEPKKTEEEIYIFVEKRYRELPDDKLGRDLLEREYAKRTTSEWGVHCFSEVNNETLMWSHYAKSQTGFCLGLNADKLFHYMTNESRIKGYWLDDVHYDDEYPYISPYIDSWNSNDQLRQIFRVKAKKWEYEKEWRLIWAHERGRQIIFGNDIIEEIILGLSCSEENRERVMQLAKGTKIEVYQASFIDRSFNIDTRNIQLQ